MEKVTVARQIAPGRLEEAVCHLKSGITATLMTPQLPPRTQDLGAATTDRIVVRWLSREKGRGGKP